MIDSTSKGKPKRPHTAIWIVIVGALLSAILPWVLTRDLGLVSFIDSGPIGDTIGGIAGPILNFTGLIVLYYSLTEQFAANKLQEQLLEQEKSIRNNERNFALSLELVDRTGVVYAKALTTYYAEGANKQYFGEGITGVHQGIVVPYFNSTNPMVTALFKQLSDHPLQNQQEAAIAAILASTLLTQIREMKDIFDGLGQDSSSVSSQEGIVLALLTKHSIIV